MRISWSLSVPRQKFPRGPCPVLATSSLTSPQLQTSHLAKMSDFTTLGVDKWLVDSLRAMAIRKPTPIQAACIEPILNGQDCIGGSRTGSGKTVAFGVPILQTWARDPFGIFAVVLTPTRYFPLWTLLLRISLRRFCGRCRDCFGRFGFVWQALFR